MLRRVVNGRQFASGGSHRTVPSTNDCVSALVSICLQSPTAELAATTSSPLAQFCDMESQIPADAAAAVLKRSEPLPETAVSVQGPDLGKTLSLQDLLNSYERIGFQATSLGKAIEIVNRMVHTHLSVIHSIFILPISAKMAPLRRACLAR